MAERIPKEQHDGRYDSAMPRLVFLEDAQTLLTPFLTDTFEMIYKVAKGELGDSLDSAYVTTWVEMEDEDAEEVLVLSLIADKGWPELGRAQKKVLHKIAQESAAWTDEQREDYRKKVFFELTPLDV